MNKDEAVCYGARSDIYFFFNEERMIFAGLFLVVILGISVFFEKVESISGCNIIGTVHANVMMRKRLRYCRRRT